MKKNKIKTRKFFTTDIESEAKRMSDIVDRFGLVGFINPICKRETVSIVKSNNL